ncbi:MAG: putative selenium-dependent hydroxylase accessory protein YqeC [Oscillospiraceae bacterium]|nr:putative selenium-dependent hydroxylase accessory protein YqeC [Oscillospiraceae bacterium]
MIYAIVGSGGKTGLLKEMAARFRQQGKTVFVTTTTHMFIEEDTVLTDDIDVIINALRKNGYVFAGVPDGLKIKGLPEAVYTAVCDIADVVLVEADGSKHMPLKYPNETEPVIPDNADEIMVVCGLHGLNKAAKDVCHRLELVKQHLRINDDTLINPDHVYTLLMEGYVKPLQEKYPRKKITLIPKHDGSLYQRTIAAMLKEQQNPGVIRKEWFCPQPRLIICGGGHVAKEVAAIAARLDFHIRVIDDRPEIITANYFPATAEVICDSYDNLGNYLEKGACYIVVTPNHRADYQCVCAILGTDFQYLGMIGSRGKVATTKEKLQKDGYGEDQISRIFAPIGLAINAVTPAEIAISILAQIIQEKNKTHAASVDKVLLESTEPGMLCIITQKHGSTPRGIGSMMLVTKDHVQGSIGGGEPEYLAIQHARAISNLDMQDYTMNNTVVNGLDMVCGGRIKVLFVPV